MDINRVSKIKTSKIKTNLLIIILSRRDFRIKKMARLFDYWHYFFEKSWYIIIRQF